MNIKSINTSVGKTEWYCNGTRVATCTVGSDLFCTVKHGTPSNIRDKRKKTYRTDWDFNGLRSLGFDTSTRYFKNTYPDLTWGDQGSILSKKSLTQKLESAPKIG